MKKLLNLLVMSIMLVMILGVVSAFGFPSCSIDITNPENGDVFSDSMDITWTGSECAFTYNVLWSQSDDCEDIENDWSLIDIAGIANQPVNFDTSSLDDGDDYCLAVVSGEDIDGWRLEDSERYDINRFEVDNSDPEADANGPYSCYEGETVTLDSTGSTDNGGSGIVNYEWIVDDETVYSGSKDTYEYNCEDGDATLNVELIVTDKADNTDGDNTIIGILNVDPWAVVITPERTDTAVGEPVTFDGSAEDVPIDYDYPLTYTWTFDGTDVLVGKVVEYTWESASPHEVELCVEDKDEGETCILFEIDVVEPTTLDEQEVAAYYELDADFGEDAGSADNSFDSGVIPSSDVICDAIDAPVNMNIYGSDSDCIVEWNSPRPTNDEQGTHNVLVRVSNNGDYEYYTFDVIVYSWIIELEEGWNLFSIPYVHETGDIDNILDRSVREKIDKIWSYEYDAVDDESSWNCRKPTSSGSSWSTSACASGISKITSIESGRGYWINVDEGEEAIIKGFGTQLGESPGMPPEIDVPTNNWALIGRYGILGMEGCYEAGPIFKGIALDSLDKIDNDLHVYNVDEDAHLDEMNILFNNQGYWLWIEDNAFNNAGSETYAPLDKYYEEDLACSL